MKKVTLSHNADCAYLEDIKIFHVSSRSGQNILLNRGEAKKLMQFLIENILYGDQ